MALTFVKRSALPVAILGKAPTNQVTISDKGQITLSSLAAEPFGSNTKIYIAFDGTKAMFFSPTSPLIEKAIKAGKLDADSFYEMKHPKGSKAYQFSAAPLLKHASEFGASANYDADASGYQSYPANWDAKNKVLTFELPESGKLPKKPVVTRARRSTSASKVNGVAANPDSTVGTPVAPPPEDDNLSLDA